MHYDGNKWRSTHQATVDAVLGGDKRRKVTSQGSQFFNRDNWTARTFAHAMCEWTRLNRNATPTRAIVEGWVNYANHYSFAGVDKFIQIAETPNELSRGTAMALVGGAYHEAWHTEYSRRTPIKFDEVWEKVQALWPLLPYNPEKGQKGWGAMSHMLLHWSNLIEDIRIERLGCKEFPGAPSKMGALQDLILQMEKDGQEGADHKGVSAATVTLGVVMGTFRDLGLGYQTSLQRQVIDEYQVRSPEGYRLVAEGALRPLLERAINLGRNDDMESLWLSMEVIATIAQEAWSQAEKKDAEKKEKTKDENDDKGAKAPPQKVDQIDATPEDKEEEQSGGSQEVITEKPLRFKVGDRVRFKAGPNAGKVALVTSADLPDPVTGLQDLTFELLEE